MRYLLVDDSATTEELREALGHVNRYAKRVQHIVERFSADAPTDWTVAHGELNDLLDMLMGRLDT
jgi:hypothetical protein